MQDAGVEAVEVARFVEIAEIVKAVETSEVREPAVLCRPAFG